MKPIVVIPARMNSSRLPGKPLADIHGEPMIRHVLRRGLEADVGPVLVAAGDPEIANALALAGGNVILTDPNLASGSDRSHAALSSFDLDGNYDVIVNLQGDMPTISPSLLRKAISVLDDPQIDIVTLATPISDPAEAERTAVVKVAMEPAAENSSTGRAIYFSRWPIPYGARNLLHHIGLYVYRRNALDKFVAAQPSQLERLEKLEQLRALVLGLIIGVAVVDTHPLGVDTPEDLDEARRLLAPSAAAIS
ncbi:3-deoxy-manno-octulosonate cytidylyltransferase [Mesorhizobium sp.]|uniref:3-deoxy-manno-octulosonate cytidylyltransferase n=1 Tax=Mesorhizobium sp. TaxID=1871066 RepID=UPI001209EB7A|nr:3-deoxy-manno-octulosonate cytidylyltransferase [Mesorhizobium sp.]TIU42767.1 MAG: 3-deoxy-manno-octulosonate cytidylyltransferase [Mesorhizobium sp.]TIV62348.1 MAG: 3-deoxy-manno-octulosonate cytidylyltransferase [Mesorhizobium sp.]